MEQINSTMYPEDFLTLEEWMQEFKVGRAVPKVDNGRAKEMMDMWQPLEKSFFDKLLQDIKINSIFRS